MSNARQRITRVLRVLLAVNGLCLVGRAVLGDLLDGRIVYFGALEQLLAATGLAYVLLGGVLQRLPFCASRASLGLVSVSMLVLCIECAGRTAGYDFNNTAANWQAMPICYQQPTVPVGNVHFRRPGSATWTGKVLTARLEQFGASESNAYADEREQTIAYDQHGFRNPDTLKDWEIVIVGDSFTELGHLPDDDLFSSRIAKALDVRVKNLGVSFTGAFNQSFFLREYGIAARTKDVVLVFFEGNDLYDIVREYRALERWKATGERDYRDVLSAKETSFMRAVGKLVANSEPGERVESNAVFTAGDDAVPVTVSYAVPNAAELDGETQTAVRAALADYAESATAHQLRPWLVYMPCKRRALHVRLDSPSDADGYLADWRPSDLPGWVGQICEDQEIRFLDLTPLFVERTARGQLTFNHVWDTHLNRDGALLVAQSISEAMRLEWERLASAGIEEDVE